MIEETEVTEETEMIVILEEEEKEETEMEMTEETLCVVGVQAQMICVSTATKLDTGQTNAENLPNNGKSSD